MVKEFVTNLLNNKNSVVHKSAKKGQLSFRLTQQLLQSIWLKSKKLKHVPALIISIPANKDENYVVTCNIKKEKK